MTGPEAEEARRLLESLPVTVLEAAGLETHWLSGIDRTLADEARIQVLEALTELTALTAVAQPASRPHEFRLEQNHPNPFNPETMIGFSVHGRGDVELAIYNLAGQRARTLLRAVLEAGKHSARWDGPRRRRTRAGQRRVCLQAARRGAGRYAQAAAAQVGHPTREIHAHHESADSPRPGGADRRPGLRAAEPPGPGLAADPDRAIQRHLPRPDHRRGPAGGQHPRAHLRTRLEDAEGSGEAGGRGADEPGGRGQRLRRHGAPAAPSGSAPRPRARGSPASGTSCWRSTRCATWCRTTACAGVSHPPGVAPLRRARPERDEPSAGAVVVLGRATRWGSRRR